MTAGEHGCTAHHSLFSILVPPRHQETPPPVTRGGMARGYAEPHDPCPPLTPTTVCARYNQPSPCLSKPCRTCQAQNQSKDGIRIIDLFPCSVKAEHKVLFGSARVCALTSSRCCRANLSPRVTVGEPFDNSPCPPPPPDAVPLFHQQQRILEHPKYRSLGTPPRLTFQARLFHNQEDLDTDRCV